MHRTRMFIVGVKTHALVRIQRMGLETRMERFMARKRSMELSSTMDEAGMVVR